MITLSKEQTEEIILKIKAYFNEKLDQEIGGFDAEFLLEFFSKEIGHYFYNQALADIHTVFDKQMESMADTLYALEKSPESNV